MEIYEGPRNRFVAEFIGTPRINSLPGRLQANGGSTTAQVSVNGITAAVSLTDPLESQDVTVGVRAEHISLGDGTAKQCIDGTLLFLERLGESTLLHVALPDETILVCRDYLNTDKDPGKSVSLAVDWSHAVIFDVDGHALPAKFVAGNR
jgi:ABC-type sugar transport system ATPase subunit